MDKLQLLRSTEWHDLPVDHLAIGVHGVSLVVTPYDAASGAYRSLRLFIGAPHRLQLSGSPLSAADLSRLEVSSFAVEEDSDAALSGTLTILPGSAGIWSVEFRGATWDLAEAPTAAHASRRERRVSPYGGRAAAYAICFLVAMVLSLLPPAMWADMVMPMEDNWENWYWRGQPYPRPDFSLHNSPPLFAAELSVYKALVIPPAHLSRAVTGLPTAYGTLWVPPYLETAGIPPLAFAVEHVKWAVPLWFAATIALYELLHGLAVRRKRRHSAV